MSVDPVIARNAALLRQLMEEVALQGRDMMAQLVARASQALQMQADGARDAREREWLNQLVWRLREQAQQLISRYPQALRDGFSEFLGARTSHAEGEAELKFDQLELMDDRQVQEEVEIARGLQMTILAVEPELAQFKALICTLLGLKQVQVNRNPMRPEIFVRALRNVLAESGVEASVSHRWTQIMLTELGPELRKLYDHFQRQMVAQGIKPAEYSVLRAPESSANTLGLPAAQRAQAAPGAEAAGLTLRQLKRLLSSEQELPAARARLSSKTSAESRVLGQEVVNLIIANISADPRLLPSVRRELGRLEPALLRLAISDPRFFGDKRHPARVLLEEVVQHSFGFESEQASGFSGFIEQMSRSFTDLDQLELVDSQSFIRELTRLRAGWVQQEQYRQQKHESAKQALMRAAQRNGLASELANTVLNRPDIGLIPEVVVTFVIGPWVQVMADARLSAPAVQTGDVDYETLVGELFWSVQPDEAGKNLPALVKLIPNLLAGLRQGLRRIDFPQSETEQFFSALMALHERSLNPHKGAIQHLDAAPGFDLTSRPSGLTTGGTPWLAPEEARDSGFMPDLDDAIGSETTTDFAATEPMPMELLTRPDRAVPDPVAQLQIGDWGELLAAGQWVPVQLTWATPQGTLFLFTGLQGRTHSMTRRLLERMCQQQHFRIGAPASVVDRALDSVTRVAMRNSVLMDIQDESAG